MFSDDTGLVPEPLAVALAAYEADPSSYPQVLEAVAESRLVLPIVAVPGAAGSDPDSHCSQVGGEMGAVVLTSSTGRQALLAFSGVAALARWNPSARPMPVTGRDAAHTAVAEGVAALLVDVAGPTRVVIDGDDLQALAAGWTLARVGDEPAWIGPVPD